MKLVYWVTFVFLAMVPLNYAVLVGVKLAYSEGLGHEEAIGCAIALFGAVAAATVYRTAIKRSAQDRRKRACKVSRAHMVKFVRRMRCTRNRHHQCVEQIVERDLNDANAACAALVCEKNRVIDSLGGCQPPAKQNPMDADQRQDQIHEG